MTRLVLLVAVAVVAGTAFLVSQDLSGPVLRVLDGDTIDVELGGERERVRYIGIDTPEMGDDRPDIRSLAFDARRANARLVEGRRVWLELDVEKRAVTRDELGVQYVLRAPLGAPGKPETLEMGEADRRTE